MNNFYEDDEPYGDVAEAFASGWVELTSVSVGYPGTI